MFLDSDEFVYMTFRMKKKKPENLNLEILTQKFESMVKYGKNLSLI